MRKDNESIQLQNELLESLGDEGIKITPSIKRRIDNELAEVASEKATKAYERYQKEQAKKKLAFADKVTTVRQGGSVGVTSLLLTLAPILAFILLAYTEIKVLHSWFAYLEGESNLYSWVASIALVVFFMVIASSKQVIDSQYDVQTSHKFTLIKLLDDTLYFIGVTPMIVWISNKVFNTNLTVYRDSVAPIVTLVNLGTLAVNVTIVTLGLLGRIAPTLASDEYNSIAWYQVFIRLLNDDFLTLASVITGGLFTLIIVFMFEVSIYIFYQDFVQLTGGIRKPEFSTLGKDYTWVDFYQAEYLTEMQKLASILKSEKKIKNQNK